MEAAHAGVVVAGNGIGALFGGLCSARSRHRRINRRFCPRVVDPHYVWLPAVREVGLEGVRFHDLRHTHAAMLISQGEHPKVIQSRLGHASITTTLNTYGHLFEGLDGAAADRLDDTWNSAPAPGTRPEKTIIALPTG